MLRFFRMIRNKLIEEEIVRKYIPLCYRGNPAGGDGDIDSGDGFTKFNIQLNR
jgi:hypothetical protein